MAAAGSLSWTTWLVTHMPVKVYAHWNNNRSSRLVRGSARHNVAHYLQQTSLLFSLLFTAHPMLATSGKRVSRLPFPLLSKVRTLLFKGLEWAKHNTSCRVIALQGNAMSSKNEWHSWNLDDQMCLCSKYLQTVWRSFKWKVCTTHFFFFFARWISLMQSSLTTQIFHVIAQLGMCLALFNGTKVESKGQIKTSQAQAQIKSQVKNENRQILSKSKPLLQQVGFVHALHHHSVVF